MSSPVSSNATSTASSEAHQLVDHFFRHEAGRLTATLARAFGMRRLELVEDVVQAAFVRALASWSKRGVPADPAGWLFRVAQNCAIDAIRRERKFDQARAEFAIDAGEGHSTLAASLDDALNDDRLRMLFLCCHPALPAESQVAFALKMVGGFGVREIARALLTTEGNIRKRVARARAQLRCEKLDLPNPAVTSERLAAVHAVIYLIFNEGYNSNHGDKLVRQELCEEAVRLGQLLAANATVATPTTYALLALMAFHAARLEARTTAAACGEVVLLEQQDRLQWDSKLIAAGFRWFAASAEGDQLSTYHLEAGIAAEHCLAPKFERTNWPRIVEMYDRLQELRPSAIQALNRAIALAYARGPQAGLDALERVEPRLIPASYYLWDATKGELHRRLGNREAARRHLIRALELTPSSQERALLESRIASLHDVNLPAELRP